MDFLQKYFHVPFNNKFYDNEIKKLLPIIKELIVNDLKNLDDKYNKEIINFFVNCLSTKFSEDY